MAEDRRLEIDGKVDFNLRGALSLTGGDRQDCRMGRHVLGSDMVNRRRTILSSNVA